MRISQLDGQRVALWGWGREGRAAYRVIRAQWPRMPLTLFCLAGEVPMAHALRDNFLQVETELSGESFLGFDVVVKSPGISPYCDAVTAAAAQGTRFIGGTALWFSEHPDARTLCVTGTKGKSTTTAILAHLLRAGGHRTALAGNIGLPLLELMDAAAEFWAIELSSFQTSDVAMSGVRPEVAVVLNIFPEHLDWHGSQARYVEDKLRLLTQARPRLAVLNANDPTLAALSLPDSQVHWFGRGDGWHLRGDALFRGDTCLDDAGAHALPGRHNRDNLCAVLTVIDSVGLDAAALLPHVASFRPLPHRLQVLGTRDGITYVNDSISTTPHASLAALAMFGDRPTAILIGGHDRGIDWDGFAAAMHGGAPASIITMGQNGPRIFELLAPLATREHFTLDSAADLGDAMRLAKARLGRDGVVLLSPGAPSFGAYRDYTERGRHFAALAGFDPDAITAIPGLGVA
ncbi:UDP-N-acetylmuramoyl-L-alanine--D-glutamate ligase [Cognatiluteimonas profundi]|uniref:UDP-N-acetylmuramoyl-L-alanine--D-glutamate ligase n=1 Tax=Cognatiluteimonas profundi TaxID=2594501 RepID=UPI00131B1D8F|nr:UDP-N-acetylmuramoyl-L-alanine--D-glutamate ligase [Lysobacter profundi]